MWIALLAGAVVISSRNQIHYSRMFFQSNSENTGINTGLYSEGELIAPNSTVMKVCEGKMFFTLILVGSKSKEIVSLNKHSTKPTQWMEVYMTFPAAGGESCTVCFGPSLSRSPQRHQSSFIA